MFQKVVKWASLSACLAMLTLLMHDALVSIFSPFPHRIGEGMMAWMSSQILAGRMPYGDILAIPSRYSCYGFFPSLLAALPGLAGLPGFAGEGLVRAGRAMVFVSWCVASFALAFAVRPKSVNPLAAGCLFLCVASQFWAFYAFRVDSFALALEAVILLSLVRLSGRRLAWSIAALAPMLALTRIPAALDILPLAMLSAYLRAVPLATELRRLARPMAIGALSAATVLLLANLASGGWMLNNIVAVQLLSGPTTAEIFCAVADFVLRGPQATLLWAGALVLLLSRSGSVALWAMSLSLLACGALATKDGADHNYYLPFLLVGTAASMSALDRRGILPLALLSLPFMFLPLQPALHRAPAWEIEARISRYQEVADLHRRPAFLTDDPYYSVAVGTEPLATDLFQLSRALAASNRTAASLVESASGAWGGEFIWALLGRTVSPDSPLGSPLPHGYYQSSVHLYDPRTMVPSSPPQIARHGSLWRLYVRKVAVPCLLMAVAGLFAATAPRRLR